MATNLLQKTAHVAVGIPVTAARNLIDRAKDLRSEIAKTGDRVGDDLRKEFDKWVDEGEALIARITEARDEGSEKVAELRKKAETQAGETRAQMKKSTKNIAETARAASKTVTEPFVPVDEVNGIGPATAKKLAKAGVTTVSGLLERTETRDEMASLADQTGISVDQLAEWREQADLTRIKGVGAEYQGLLQAAKIGTIPTLAEMDAAELERRFDQLTSIGFDHVPSKEISEDWIVQAKKLV